MVEDTRLTETVHVIVRFDPGTLRTDAFDVRRGGVMSEAVSTEEGVSFLVMTRSGTLEVGGFEHDERELHPGRRPVESAL